MSVEPAANADVIRVLGMSEVIMVSTRNHDKSRFFIHFLLLFFHGWSNRPVTAHAPGNPRGRGPQAAAAGVYRPVVGTVLPVLAEAG